MCAWIECENVKNTTQHLQNEIIFIRHFSLCAFRYVTLQFNTTKSNWRMTSILREKREHRNKRSHWRYILCKMCFWFEVTKQTRTVPSLNFIWDLLYTFYFILLSFFGEGSSNRPFIYYACSNMKQHVALKIFHHLLQHYTVCGTVVYTWMRMRGCICMYKYLHPHL